MTGETYVLDCTIDPGDGLHCFIPYEERDGKPVFVVGMNYLSSSPPDGAHLLGVVHMDGQEECDRWCAANADELKRLFGDRYTTPEPDRVEAP